MSVIEETALTAEQERMEGQIFDEPERPAISNNFALSALVYAAKSFRRSGNENLLKHGLGTDSYVIDELQICHAAKQLSLKALHRKGAGGKIEFLPLPALIKLNDVWCVLLEVEAGGWRLYRPETDHIELSPLPPKSQLEQLDFILLAENELSKEQVTFGLRWFAPSVFKHVRQLRDVFLVAIVLQLVALVTPMLFSSLIDKVLVGRGVSSLHVIALAMLGLALAEPMYTYLRGNAFGHLASKVNSELSSRLYRHLTCLPLSYFQQRQTGQIIARVREMAQIRQFLTGSALMLVLDLIFVGVFLAVMFNYAPLLTWLVIGSLVIYFVLWLIAGPIIRARVLKQYEADASSTSFLTESVTGIETIKTTATEKDFLHQWRNTLSGQIKSAFSAAKAGIIAGQGIAFIQKITAAILLWWGVKAVLEGDLSAGELVAFNMLAGHVTQPILRLAQIWQDFQHTIISLKRVGDILNEPAENNVEGLASVPQLAGQVEFQHVRFRYQQDTPEVLSDLNLTIQPGEFVGITGPSGSGKSTLTRLLQRLYTPQHGQVLVDGMDLAIADPVSLRQNMSVVLQESVLFAGSIADNIRFCKPEATDEEVLEAAKLAGALTFILDFPRGFETDVGERGAKLSGGQRQRVALARALIVKPRILILDEATSALDYESEAAIISNLQEISAGRTVISIAHRLNTIKHADRILVIEEGKIKEQGNHEELTDQGGLYSKLWKTQIGH